MKQKAIILLGLFALAVSAFALAPLGGEFACCGCAAFWRAHSEGADLRPPRHGWRASCPKTQWGFPT